MTDGVVKNRSSDVPIPDKGTGAGVYRREMAMQIAWKSAQQDAPLLLYW